MLAEGGFNRNGGLLSYGDDGGKDLRDYVSGSGHGPVGAVLSGCARHGIALRRRNCGILFPAPDGVSRLMFFGVRGAMGERVLSQFKD